MVVRTIDYRAVAAQAFGKGHDPMDSDRVAADEILAGRLAMPPHPAWDLPEQITWDENPYAQRNWVAQFHMLRWLEPVRRIAESGDRHARDYWITTTKSWIAANPVGASKSEYAWKDMVDGIRALALVFGLSLVEKEDNEWLTDAIWEHGIWLSNESNLGHSNHALHQHQALLVIGLVFKNDTWRDLALSRLVGLLETSYDDEGVNAEGAIDYHRLNYVWWETAFRRLDLAGISRPKAAERLSLAALELAYATKPNRQFERIGDTERGGPSGLSSPEIDYVNSEGAEGQPPSDLTRVFKAGYVFGRSGWGNYERPFRDELFFSLSFGAANRVHGHQDGASLTLHSNGHPWLIDAGKYAYNNDEMRAYCTSRMGHNVVVIKDKPYNPQSIVRLKRSSLSQELEDFEFRDNGYPGVELIRRVIYCRGGDFFVVIDTVSSEQGVTAYQRWHLDSETAVSRTKTGFSLKRGKSSATIEWRGKSPALTSIEGQSSPYDGWMSSGWMQKKAAPVLIGERSGKRFRYVSVIGTGELGISSLAVQEGQTALNVTVGRTTYELGIGQDEATVSARSTHDAPLSKSYKFDVKHSLKLLSKISAPKMSVPPMDEGFTPDYWAKLRAWIRLQPNVTEARLSAIRVVLEYLQLKGPSDRNDQGLRSSLIDLVGSDIGPRLKISSQGLGLLREPMISWEGASAVRSTTYKSHFQTALNPSDLAVPESGTALYSLESGGLTLPVMVGRGAEETGILSVRFHGAVNRTRAVLPMFPGATAEKSSGNNFAIFADPTLDLDRTMNLAWYLGAPAVNLYEYMAEAIRGLAVKSGAKKVILTGNSGGGYAALQVGSYIPQACVLALSPQTVIPDYHQVAVTRALDAYSPNFSRDLLNNPNSELLSAVERFRNLPELPKVVYVQNMEDAHHVKNHFAPFMDMLNAAHSSNPRVKPIEIMAGRGHVAVTKDQYAQFWAMAVEHLEI